MPFCLGIDTSNYTTSTALFDTDTMEVVHSKKLLPVKEGELGLRQSDAVFHHTKQLPEMIKQLFDGREADISCIGVSVKPRNIEGSYMPCFLCGEGLADSLGAVNKIPVHKTSHQTGHILAALLSAGKLEFVNRKFIAFHVSGGTTDCLLVEPHKDNVIKITEIGTSLDLKAGQAVDRVGLMLGLKFPCGKELEKLAEQSSRSFKIKPVLKGGSCCLSGLENKCRLMLDSGESREDTANYCLSCIYAAVKGMTEYALLNEGDMPVVFAGGVMSDKIIRRRLEQDFEAYFAEPDFSCDNASGTAVFAAITEKFI
ncbi:MAG: peptidase M22 [Oscillospiraceae bacterium]|nr:peptidase M22 [Oscillospiraceae bacterium]